MAAVELEPEWDEAREQRLAALLEANYGGETLDEYIRRVSPRHPPPRHIRPIMDLWERSRHERVFACVELPPRHAKTTTGLHGLAWLMSRDPILKHGFATFGDDYAATRSRICRAMARAGGVTLDKEQANLHEWCTIQGGGLSAHGYRGEWTGKGIDGVALLDDLIKDRMAAESPKIRETVWEWFTDVFWTRLEGGSVIVQGTRWHDDDVIGRLLQGKFAGYHFEEIRLPAICEDAGDLLGRAIGEALWPERVSADELHRIEMSIGPYGWASLFQQRPRPRGADIFVEPARFSLASWRPDGHRILLCADVAATESTRADFSAAFILAAKGYGDEMEVWILHGWRDRVSVPKVARKLLELSIRYWRAPCVVEAVGGFKGVPQIMKEIEPRLKIRVAQMGDPTAGEHGGRVSNASVDKFLRSQPVAAAWNAGRVHVPVDGELVWDHTAKRFDLPIEPVTGARFHRKRLRPDVAPGIEWPDELIAEASKFTGAGDAEDDQIDGLAHGFNDLRSSLPTARGARENDNAFG